MEIEHPLKTEDVDAEEKKSVDETGTDDKNIYSLPRRLSPLNLSPRPKSVGDATTSTKLSPQESDSPACSSTWPNHLTPPCSWPGLYRPPYFFPPPPLHFPFLYPFNDPHLASLPTPPPITRDEPNSPKGVPSFPTIKEETTRSDNSSVKIDPEVPQLYKKTDDEEDPPEHYQVKWSSHASRLTSFVSSLEGDVASSDTIITASDGTTFYTHRLVLATSSPFFKRTLQNIPKDTHAVLVIPRSPSRYIAAILSFCYTGMVEVARADVEPIIELAEDLQIIGLLVENEKIKKMNLLRSHDFMAPSVFTFNQPSPNVSRESSSSESWSRSSTPSFFNTPSPFFSVPFYSPGWKRESDSPINYSQPMKRIKSESDAHTRGAKKTMKSRNSEVAMCLSASNDPAKHFRRQTNSDESSLDIIPRPGGTGSRVLLWRFLLQLLHDRRYAPYHIRWLDRSQGIFRIMESDKVAQLWGIARKNKNMTYEKMSRGMRTYYKRSILFHMDGTKLIYRFNIQEPDIQHHLRYYEMLSQRSHEDSSRPSSSDFVGNISSKFEQIPAMSSPELVQTLLSSNSSLTHNSPSSSGELQGSHFLADTPQNPHSIDALLPKSERT